MIITKQYHYYKENQNRKIYQLIGKSILIWSSVLPAWGWLIEFLWTIKFCHRPVRTLPGVIYFSTSVSTTMCQLPHTTQHTLKCFGYISEWGKKLQYHKKHISSPQYLNSGQKLRIKINKFQKVLSSARCLHNASWRSWFTQEIKLSRQIKQEVNRISRLSARIKEQ